MKLEVGILLAATACSFTRSVEGCAIPFFGDIFPSLFEKKCEEDGPTFSPTPFTCDIADNKCDPVDIRSPDDIEITSTSDASIKFPDLDNLAEVYIDAYIAANSDEFTLPGSEAVFRLATTTAINLLLDAFSPISFNAANFSSDCSSPNGKQTGFYVVSPDLSGSATVTVDIQGGADDPILLLGYDAAINTLPTITIPNNEFCVISGGTKNGDDAELDDTGNQLTLNSAAMALTEYLPGDTFSGGIDLSIFTNFTNTRSAVIAIIGEDITSFQFTTNNVVFFSVAF